MAGLSSASPKFPCTPCGNKLVTLPNVTRATTPDACHVPPGYGYSKHDGSAAGLADICTYGTYNPGYNRQTCISCGAGLLTDAPGATESDACYTPAGWGNEVSTDTGAVEYVATACPGDTYGRPNK